ncbi:MAG TPA: hypothetical protein PK079_25400 [Leptospiraceae bacterium]|nr:hypothetical protein [Leptospiraceae bacterium]HMW06391.1 hypothetical protein [Leptospiraceae bacterium]HMX31697.1 hypothetical protein [Leptospiraceae bacterium]HMY31983.1 hypothetical protein [Leptospiraceae bacterium]HMZ63153.1 hypothetical protein [Leptospiraceae bacterium]
MTELRKYLLAHNYEKIIPKVRELISENKRNFKKHEIKEWCAIRWRNLFINEAAKIPKAVSAASHTKLFGGKDHRSDKQKVAERFLKEEGPNEWRTEMPDVEIDELRHTTLIFCPGFLNGLFPVMAFEDAFPLLEKNYKLRVIQSDSHPMRSCEGNTIDILNAIEKGIGLNAKAELIDERHAVPPKDIFIIAYSKGMPDLLHLLVKRPDLKKRIKCIFNWAGAPGGSYLANTLYDSIKDINFNIKDEFDNLIKLISPIIHVPHKIRRLSEYNVKAAILDLTTEFRKEFLRDNLKKIDSLNIPIFNITASTTITEVPYFQLQGVNELNKYDANNDMQVTQKHSKLHIPMATDLAMLHGHHWDVSYNSFVGKLSFGSPNLDHPFPKVAGAIAMVKLAYELGLIE